MKKTYVVFYILLMGSMLHAQPVKFNYYPNIPVLADNGVDTLRYPFTGGLNAPQFSAIDLDGDAVNDLFVFDRSGNKVLTFLYKNGKYQYAPRYETMFPKLNSWALLRDYNCDGKVDIFSEVDYNVQPDSGQLIYVGGIRVIENISTTPGELKWHQAHNQLFNIGTQFEPPTNVSLGNSDIPAIEDIDNDGDLDLLIMPLGKNVITFYQNLSKERGHNCDSLIYVFRDECWGSMSYKVLKNEFVLNDQSPCARNYQKMAMHNGTTLCAYDKDNDGDKDLLYGDVGFKTLLLLENGKTANARNRDSVITQDTLFPHNTKPAVIEFPAAYMFDVDGDTKADLVTTTNADAGSKNRDNISFYKNTGTSAVPVFEYQRSNLLVDNTVDLGGGNVPVFVDIDGDQDKDLVVATQGDFATTSNSNDFLVLYRNKGTASNPVYQLVDTNFLGINKGSVKIYNIRPAFGDLNGDGKPDLLIGDMNGKFHYYQNATNGAVTAFNKISDDYFGIFGGTFAAPQLFDVNKDGKLDIVMGRKNGTLAYFENKGTATSPDFDATASIDSIGKINISDRVPNGPGFFYYDGYSIPFVCDLDNDGIYEILVGSEMGKVFLFNNFEPSTSRVCKPITDIFVEAPGLTPAAVSFGTRTGVTAADINADGKYELIIGNLRGGFKAYQAEVSGPISSVQALTRDEPALTVFPNPAANKLTVKGDHNLYGMQYRMINILGESISYGQLGDYNNEIDITGLTPGMYILSATGNDGTKVNVKFMVQR